jgi:hypothetical protein
LQQFFTRLDEGGLLWPRKAASRPQPTSR